jgi:hypothetical protein
MKAQSTASKLQKRLHQPFSEIWDSENHYRDARLKSICQIKNNIYQNVLTSSFTKYFRNSNLFLFNLFVLSDNLPVAWIILFKSAINKLSEILQMYTNFKF